MMPIPNGQRVRWFISADVHYSKMHTTFFLFFFIDYSMNQLNFLWNTAVPKYFIAAALKPTLTNKAEKVAAGRRPARLLANIEFGLFSLEIRILLSIFAG